MSLSKLALAAGEDVVYQLNPMTPPLNPSEVDSAEAALEIVILWGEHSILHVAHLSPPRSFYVGDAVDAVAGHGKLATDFLIGSESLGAERLPLVVVQDSRIAVVLPAGGTGDITIDEQAVSFEALEALPQPLAAFPDADAAPSALYALPLGAAARVSYRGFTFMVRRTSAARRIGVGASERGRDATRQHAWTLASLLLHASLLLAFQFLPPRSSTLSLDLLNADSRLVSFFSQTELTIEEQTPAWLSGERHEDDEGQTGRPDREQARTKSTAHAEHRDEAPHLAPEEAKQSAASAGIIGVLKASNFGASSVFARDSAAGASSFDAIVTITGAQAGESFGFGGLGLRGHGRGGGGDAKGTVGIGGLGTMGRGRSDGTGGAYGTGIGLPGTRTAKVPQIRIGATDVHGSLSKEVIRRVIGRHLNEVRYCYEQALNARPDLQGRVAVKFIIAPTGLVQASSVDKSDLSHGATELCIAQAVRRWTFPAPEGGGIVVVNYPFVLSQSGN